MSMLEKLPDVLITYIYEYIPESYYKKMYKKVLNEIKTKCSREKILRYISNKHSIYEIYLSFNYHTKIYNIGTYILWLTKVFYCDEKMSSSIDMLHNVLIKKRLLTMN